jgi:phosphoglycolate phosphatase
LGDIARAGDGTLASLGLAPVGPDAYAPLVGGGARDLMRKLLGPGRGHLLDEALRRYEARYAQAPTAHARLYEGIGEALDALAARGLRLAILSNKPHALTRALADQLLGAWPWVEVWGGGGSPYPLKPAPDAALALARKLGLPPTRCAFVGDTSADLQTAHAAHMLAVGVTWGFRSRDELQRHHPHALLDHPRELPPLLVGG